MVLVQVVEQFNALCEQRLLRNQAATWRGIVQYEKLRSRSRKRPLPMVRALSVSYLIEHKIATPAQAARFFGCGARAVSAQRRRFYEARFREYFDAGPEMLFCPLRSGRNDAIRPRADDRLR